MLKIRVKEKLNAQKLYSKKVTNLNELLRSTRSSINNSINSDHSKYDKINNKNNDKLTKEDVLDFSGGMALGEIVSLLCVAKCVRPQQQVFLFQIFIFVLIIKKMASPPPPVASAGSSPSLASSLSALSAPVVEPSAISASPPVVANISPQNSNTARVFVVVNGNSRQGASVCNAILQQNASSLKWRLKAICKNKTTPKALVNRKVINLRIYYYIFKYRFKIFTFTISTGV